MSRNVHVASRVDDTFLEKNDPCSAKFRSTKFCTTNSCSTNIQIFVVRSLAVRTLAVRNRGIDRMSLKLKFLAVQIWEAARNGCAGGIWREVPRGVQDGTVSRERNSRTD